MTWWRNPKEHTVSFFLADAGEVLNYRVQPGDAFEVPTKFDSALQEVRDGIVVGGMARYLERLDGPPAAPEPVAESPPGDAPKPEPHAKTTRRK